MNIDGLVLESKYPEYILCVKGPLRKVWRDGFPVDEAKILELQFDRYLCEVDVMKREQEWGEQERESVSRALDQHFSDPSFRDVWVHVAVKPPAPWPTYDETHHNQIAQIAQAIGMVDEAILYEQRGRDAGPRDSVVKKLQDLKQATPDAEPVADPAEELYAV